jgi:hypothetical protein
LGNRLHEHSTWAGTEFIWVDTKFASPPPPLQATGNSHRELPTNIGMQKYSGLETYYRSFRLGVVLSPAPRTSASRFGDPCQLVVKVLSFCGRARPDIFRGKIMGETVKTAREDVRQDVKFESFPEKQLMLARQTCR